MKSSRIQLISIFLTTFICLVEIASASSSSDSTSSSPETYQVHHWVNDQPPKLRGHIRTRVLSSGRKVYNLDQEPIDIDVLNQHTTHLEDRYWVSVTTPSKQLSTSIPLCYLQSSRFVDQIVLHMDSLANEPFHVDYGVQYAVCNTTIKGLSTAKEFKTQVQSQSLVEAPRPVLETMVPTPDGKPPPQKTFLQQYWYLLIPLAILLIAPGEAPPNQGGQQQGQR